MSENTAKKVNLLDLDTPCILIGVTGCIAAYKTCELIRQLQKAGMRVKVVMTEHACKFIDPTTFRALTHEPVAVKLFDEPGDAIHHVSLAQECDVFAIAPCTANVIAKLATGIADDLLTTTALATRAPLLIAPAMNTGMYENAATQENLATLARRGIHIVEAGSGYLACGDEGKGRLADIDVIKDAILQLVSVPDSTNKDLNGLSIMITAGPTQEPIDPVRYISNYSSGKTGYALASAAAARGANVTLISGPVSLNKPEGVELVSVRTAQEMYEAALAYFDEADIAIFSAAVADVRPASASSQKLKKESDTCALANIELVENPDILASCGKRKHAGQIVIGFAAETQHLLQHAQAKLTQKNADMIVANLVGDGIAFGTTDNQVTFVYPQASKDLPQMPKTQLAHKVLDAARELFVKLK